MEPVLESDAQNITLDEDNVEDIETNEINDADYVEGNKRFMIFDIYKHHSSSHH
jgi:hypothetical protein